MVSPQALPIICLGTHGKIFPLVCMNEKGVIVQTPAWNLGHLYVSTTVPVLTSMWALLRMPEKCRRDNGWVCVGWIR